MQDTIKPVIQDTITPVNIVPLNASGQSADTVVRQQADTGTRVIVAPSSVSRKPVRQKETAIINVDTTSVCSRNPVADITFYDSLNFIRENKLFLTNRFPYSFIENNIQSQTMANASLISSLKTGKTLPAKQFHDDWLLAIILFAAFLYSVIRTTSKTMLPEVTRFFFFRGINDSSSREIGGLFNWQATLLNLISFFNIALFCNYAAEWYGIRGSGSSGFVIWLISLGLIIFAVTSRHLLCVITGSISNQEEVFREYLLGIYQSYRLSGIILFVIVVLISYTQIFGVKLLIAAGFLTFLFMYVIRVIRLFLIFINRGISIFYWILYLCSLEILPFLILLKYSFGRF